MFSFCIPYRVLPERHRLLENFLLRMAAVKGYFVVYIGGQNQEGKFNRGAAMNEAINMAPDSWIITTDADLIMPPLFINFIMPLLDKKTVLYFKYIEAGEERFPGSPGGVNVFHKSLWESVKGYSEEYIGYGYEDYDFRERIIKNGFKYLYTGIIIEHIPHVQVEDIHDDLDLNRAVYERAWKNDS